MAIRLNFIEKSGWRQLLIFLYITFVGFFLSLLLTLFLGRSDGEGTSDFLSKNTLLWLLFANQLCVFLLPALFWGYYYSAADTVRNLYLRKLPTKSYFLAVLLLLLIMPAAYWLGDLNTKLVFSDLFKDLRTHIVGQEKQVLALLKRIFTFRDMGDFLVSFGIVAVLPAVCEELFFRGVLQPIFTKIFKNVWIAIAVTAFVFSIFHFQLMGFLPRFFMGFVLGYLFYRFGSLFPTMMVHMLFNGFQVVYIYVQGTESLEKSLTSTDTIPFYVGLISLIAFVVFIWKGIQKYKEGSSVS